MPILRDVLQVIDSWYPPATAEAWDAVGLTCGDPGETVDRVALAVDCVPATVTEAIEAGAQLLVTHHPLLLGGVHSVAATQPKGLLVHRMVRAGLAHLAVHTNADVAVGGVSQALGSCLGLRDQRPLIPDPAPALDQLAVLVPDAHRERVVEALFAAGAGAVGDYDRCTFSVEGTGTFRPLPGATPHDGVIGEVTRVAEVRVAVVYPSALREKVLAAMRAAHPYEEVAFELSSQPRQAGVTGTGRIGTLPEPLTLADFVDAVAGALPATSWGVRAAGDPLRLVSRVAVCGGSGGGYVDQARAAGADVFVTSDLKHHVTLEAVTERAAIDEPPMALVDTAHWAGEFPWLDLLADRLQARFGDELSVSVSRLVTDPWTVHAH